MKILFHLSMIGILFGCSLQDRSTQYGIRVKLPIVNTNLLSGSAVDPTTTAPGTATTLSISDLQCFAINVSGPGLNADPKFGCSAAPLNIGITGGMAPTSGGTVDAMVPAGPSRLIQLLGFQSKVGCPTLDSFLSSLDSTNVLKGGTAGIGLPYLLGTTTVDVFSDTSVSIHAVLDPKKPFFSGCANSAATATTSTSPTSVPTTAKPTLSFTTSDTYASSTTGGTAVGQAIAKDSVGNLFVAGGDSTSQKWVVRKSTDGGTTWNTVDSYIPTSSSAQAQAIVVDHNDAIYVGGLINTSGSLSGIVRRSTDHGSNWTVVHNFTVTSLMSGTNFGVNGLAVDSSNHLYSATAGAGGKWTVFKSPDGVTWGAVDFYQFSTGFQSSATAITIDSSGAIYVAGYGVDSSNQWNWIVRKSTDGGANWGTIDSYQFAPTYYAYPKAIALDTSGNVFVAGFEGVFASGTIYPPSRGIVRRGTGGGSGIWSTVDPGSATPVNGAMINGIATDLVGNVYTAGFDGSAWIIKMSSDTGLTWKIIDSTGSGWGPSSIMASPSGNLLISGQSGNNWVTRMGTWSAPVGGATGTTASP